MVGSAACFDNVEDLGRMYALTMHRFFHKFSKQCRDKLYPDHVKIPSIEEEFIEIEAAYVVLGLPSVCGSMDVVHILLRACPHGLLNTHTGKEG